MLIRLGSLGAAALTLLGAAAPLFPLLDLVNHLRPLLVLGALALLVLTWITASRATRWLSGAGVALNAVLVQIPLIHAPATAPQASLRITTFNIWGRNQSADDVAHFVAETGADIVLLQEVDTAIQGALVQALRPAYPYGVSCPSPACRLFLFSKREPLSSGISGASDVAPRVWARFSNENGRDFTVSAVHLTRPYEADRQTRQIDALIRWLGEAEGTQIVVGDFNLTPFSWHLNRLSAATGLRRHGTFGASWPAPFPVVLLDNLLATPDVRSAGVTIGGASYGSDHRPLTFDLALE